MRTETLVFADGFLDDLFDPADPLVVGSRPPYLDPGATPVWGAEYPDEFRAPLPRPGRLSVLRRRRGTGLAGRLLRRRRPAPATTSTTDHRVPRGLLLAARGPVRRRELDRLRRARPAAPIGDRPRGLDSQRRLRPARPAAARGDRRQRQHHAASPSHRPGSSPPPTCAARTARATTTLPSVRDGATTCSRSPSAASRCRCARSAGCTTTPSRRPGRPARRRGHLGRVLRRVRPPAADPRPGRGHPVRRPGVRRRRAPGRPDRARTGGRRPRPARHGEPDNVVVSGWQVYDNKGRVVEKYEPFFATGFDFAAPGRRRSSASKATIVLRPPRPRRSARSTRTAASSASCYGVPADLADPDVFAPTPWETYTYDANDNAGRTHARRRRGVPRPLEHPGQHRGRRPRPHRRGRRPQRPRPRPRLVRHAGSTYDIQGNLLAVTDALGRDGVPLPLRPRRAPLADRQHRRRPPRHRARRRSATRSRAATARARSRSAPSTCCTGRSGCGPATTPAGPVTLRQRIEYGDGGDPDQPAAERAAARAHNLLGATVAPLRRGRASSPSTDVDFKGNVLDSSAPGDRRRADPRRLRTRPPPTAGRSRRSASTGNPPRPDARRAATPSCSTPTPTGRRPATTPSTASIRQLLPADVEGRRRELRPALQPRRRPGARAARRHPVRRADRLRRQGPARR